MVQRGLGKGVGRQGGRYRIVPDGKFFGNDMGSMRCIEGHVAKEWAALMFLQKSDGLVCEDCAGMFRGETGRCDPTVDHFVPLFVTLGASLERKETPDTVIDGYFLGLSKRSVQFE